MDLEQEVQMLLHEENYLDKLIENLSQVVEYNNLQNCSADAQKLLKKLQDKKEMIKETIDDLTNDMVALAEVYAMDSLNAPIDNFYFDTEE